MDALNSTFAAALRPAPLLTPAQWADRHRVLSSRASSEPGRWRTDRTPYLRAPLEELSVHGEAHTVVLMFGSQLGKSECGNNWLGYLIACEPGPVLVVQPTLDMSKRYSRQRLQPLVDETDALRQLVAAPRSRDESNTLSVKEFPGGLLLVTGANSGAGLRSMPIRYLFADEVDAWPASIPGEGDPLELARKRQSTFANRKTLIVSTPTVAGQSRIDRLFALSDRREFEVPCPHCGEFQVLRWSGLQWPQGQPAEAVYHCGHCGEPIEERHKETMLPAGRWVARGESEGIAGFHLSTLYAPLGWTSWAELAREYEEAMEFMRKGDSSVMQTFHNTRLAKTWEPRPTKAVEAHELQRHCGEYVAGSVPVQEPVALVAGVDVQDDRLEVSVFAHGEHGRSWLVTHELIEGSPGDTGTWDELAQLLGRQWPRPDGRTYLHILLAHVDSGGHYTEQVYGFAAQRRRGVMAVKGASVDIAGLVSTVRLLEPRSSGHRFRFINTSRAKMTLIERLGLEPGAPGSIAFPKNILELVPEYFDQLTAEKLVETASRGANRLRWQKPRGARNEALDCAVYALTAAAVATQGMTAAHWAELGRRLDVQLIEAPPPPPPAPPDPLAPLQDPTQPPRWARPMRLGGGNWVTSWKPRW